MARANLIVDDELRDVFVNAAEQSPPVRWIQARLNDVRICVEASGPASDNMEDDLEAMKSDALADGKPSFLLFCLEIGAESQAWVLIAYVPDNSKVKARMLYASGVADVKEALGYSNFSGSAHVTSPDELTLDSIRGTTKREFSDQPLTESELLAKEEVAQMAPPSEARANAMGLVPFDFTDDVEAALEGFRAGSVDLVEFVIEGDSTVALGETSPSTRLSSSTIATSEPRFYLVRQVDTSNNVYYIFSCPEGTKIRVRMLYSTCKATLAHHIDELGIELTKVFELGDPSDIDDLLKMYDTPDESAGKIKQANYAKPSRPGRGKARIMKKK
ncbi:Twinfilin [Hondaea fermentalgiana]|uniref:Twinfilin n=1 Tax=Hondaea fermentalgiana TaxID=2315210 RepID=A0A2R5GMV4_9STRA|nr:Twinfilin [Hondaea fermentalgiana]|eukprot:GBG32220.1 Twinfilin [Hondaea fermentalgiana]